jgi:predicted DsbA family dithiol-disulfide isomerase
MFWSVLLIDAIFLNYLLVGPDIIKDDKDMASKYQKKKQAAAQVEASDKEQTYGIMVITACKIPRSYPSLNLYHYGKHDSIKHSFTHCYMQTYFKPFRTMHMLEIKRTTW